MGDGDAETKFSEEENEVAVIAAKVRLLFQKFRKENGDRFSYAEVEALTGGKIAASWISRLANNHAQRPGLRALKALSDFFDVDITFWVEPLEAEPIKRSLLRSTSADVQSVALRGAKIEGEHREDVLPPEDQAMLNQLEAFFRRRRADG